MWYKALEYTVDTALEETVGLTRALHEQSEEDCKIELKENADYWKKEIMKTAANFVEEELHREQQSNK